MGRGGEAVSILSLASRTFFLVSRAGPLSVTVDTVLLPGRKPRQGGRGVWKLKLFSRSEPEGPSISASLSMAIPVILILGVVKVVSPAWSSSSLSSSSISSSASAVFSLSDFSSTFMSSSSPSPPFSSLPSNAILFLFLLLFFVFSSS